MSRRLERHVDFDLAERILASGPIKRKQPPKTTKLPRAGKTYRAARRNDDRKRGWPEATFAKSRPLASHRFIPLNRSQNWPRANSYEHAREIGPSSEPVR
jgi:hypothetical protein